MFCIIVLLKDRFLKMFKSYNLYCKIGIPSVLEGIADKKHAVIELKLSFYIKC